LERPSLYALNMEVIDHMMMITGNYYSREGIKPIHFWVEVLYVFDEISVVVFKLN